MCAYKLREIITFLKLKTTIRPSYMSVHTCCCILICIEWFVSKFKREFKNTFENLFGIFEKKKKRNSFSLPSPSPSFGPLGFHLPAAGPSTELTQLGLKPSIGASLPLS